jgi:ATP-dependent Clp protease ATP-binding subunit ClpA
MKVGFRTRESLRAVKGGSPKILAVTKAILKKYSCETFEEIIDREIAAHEEKQKAHAEARREKETLAAACRVATNAVNVRYYHRPFEYGELSEDERKEMTRDGSLLRDRDFIPSAFGPSTVSFTDKEDVKKFLEAIPDKTEEAILHAEKRIKAIQQAIDRARALLALPGKPVDFETYWKDVMVSVEKSREENANG